MKGYSMRFIAALACIVIGFAVALIEESFLFPSLAWFVAAIAIAVLPPFRQG